MSDLRTVPVAVDNLRLPETPLFSTSWWLDAVSPGAWDEVTVINGDAVTARLRYGTRHVRVFGDIVRMPIITPYLGPELFGIERGGPKAIGDAHALVEQLIDKLPVADSITIACHPNFDSWLPFHWKGYEQRTRYTHRIVDIEDADRVFSEFSSSTRRAIRKAEKTVEVRTLDSSDVLYDQYQRTFDNQGKSVSLDKNTLRRATSAAIERDQGVLLGAVDAEGAVHAAMFLVWNNSVTYYLVGGSDPERRSSGAMSLLFWHAIKMQAQRTRCLDFEGSMIPGIERFFRGFGAMPVPAHQVWRDSTKAKLVKGVLNTIKPGR